MFSVFKKSPKYVYVLVRTDIPLANQMVQVGHACFEHGCDVATATSNPSSMVLFEVETEQQLVEIANWLDKKIPGQSYVMYEPDYDIGYTAICTSPFSGEDRDIFSKFDLYATGRKPRLLQRRG